MWRVRLAPVPVMLRPLLGTLLSSLELAASTRLPTSVLSSATVKARSLAVSTGVLAAVGSPVTVGALLPPVTSTVRVIWVLWPPSVVAVKVTV